MLTLLVTAALAGPAAAADAIGLRSGQILLGVVRDFDGRMVDVELEQGGRTRLPLADLTPVWQYRLLRDRAGPTDAAAQMALGDFCRDQGLAASARDHWRRAARLDPARAETVERALAELDEHAAGVLFAELLARLGEKRYDRALEVARAIESRFPDAAPAAWTRDLLPAIQLGIARQAQARELAAKANDLGAEVARELARERVRTRLEEAVDRHLGAARTSYTQGLEAEGEDRITPATRAYEEASEQFRLAVEAIEALRPHVVERDAILAHNGRHAQVLHAWVQLCLSAAHLRARQGNYKDAHRWTSLAKRLEPLNKRVDDFHDAIEDSRIHKSLKKLTNSKTIVSDH